jgi:high-affinity iron transporter
MLINTVLMFLRELLPLCLMLATLLVWHRASWQRFALCFALPAALMLLLISSQMLWISEQWDGLGLELLYSALYLSCFALLCLAALSAQVALFCSALAAACLLSISGSNLLLYIWLPTRGESTPADLLLGTALGCGIGASIAVLWYYLLTELRQWRMYSFSLVLSLLGVRQVMMASALLIQSDWLIAGQELWQTSHLLSEQSEFGFFLQALMGYEATPVLSQLLLYVLCFGLLFWCCSVMEKRDEA